MSSIFGNAFKYISWGESHGRAIGAVVDGAPSNIELDEDSIQYFLDKRKPGNNSLTSPRKESDKINILSGIFEGKTTGSPISLMIYNEDHNSKDYDEISNKYRPGHSDYVYHQKYQNYDYRGGGRASARETAMRVAVGAIARKIIPDIKISSALISIGELSANKLDFEFAAQNSLSCPDPALLEVWQQHIKQLLDEGNSVGGIVEIRASNVPIGLGKPIYNKLDGDLASAFMSINAVKGVEIGKGFASSKDTGSVHADQMAIKNNLPYFLSNNSGGITAGISTGQDIIVRFSVKPTSSIKIPLKTITKDLTEDFVSTKGRHDPCAAIRAVPVGEAMMAIVLADHFLLRKTEL